MCTDELKSRNNLTLSEINMLLAEEKNINVYRKLEYFKFKAMGFSKNESCELAGLKESSKYYLEKLWYLGGYNALVPHYGGGRDPKLTDEQISKLSDILTTKDKWIVNDVKKLIKEQFNVNYSYQGVRELLIRSNVEIANYFQEEADNKNKLHNVVENFEDISSDDKKEIENLIDKINGEHSIYVIKKLIYLLFRKIGFSNKVASYFLSITTGTGSNWLNAWNNNDYEGLLRKPGQGRKSKLNDEEWDELKKKLSENDDWLTWEILSYIQNEFGVTFHPSYIIYALKKNFGGYYSKPHRVDYRRSPYYKSAFYLMLYTKFRKYHIKYDEITGNMVDLNSNKKVLIFSFDEAAFQFIGNYIKVYSLTKPEMKIDTNRYTCKAAGFFSLTPEGKDYITFLENSKKETIGEVLKEIRIENDDAIIFLTIDNFSSHRSDYVKDIAKEIGIELCFLPPYSPQLQPIERKWLGIKQHIMKHKIRYIPNFREKSDDEKLGILKSLVENSFYELSKDKNSWNYIDNSFIKPIIKKLHPRTNSNLVLEKC